MISKIWFILFLFFYSGQAQSDSPIEVYFISHSHTDAGWIETWDTYFESVKQILNSTLVVMEEHPEFKFNWADTNFLAYWYDQSTEEIQKRFKLVVERGQVGFMGGSWVMNDEALPQYKDIFLNQETGFKWLNKTFGVKPRVAWQIDAFGNSAVTPAIFSQLGFEAIVLSRVGTTVYETLENQKSLEFIWTGVQTSKNSSLFAHELTRCTYQVPNDFRFENKGLKPWDHPKVICDSEALDKNLTECMKRFDELYVQPSL